nr:hypothetical protein [Tanacetum cinerariifolium]
MDLNEEKKDLEIDIDDNEEEELLFASPPPLSPIRTPPPESESSFDYDIPVTTTTTMGRPFKGLLSTYEGMGTHRTKIVDAHEEAIRSR